MQSLPLVLRIVDDLVNLIGLHFRSEIDRVTAVFIAFKDMGNCLRSPTISLCIMPSVVPALRKSVGSRRRDTLFRQDTGNLHRTVAVNAELKNLANHLGAGSSITQRFLSVSDFL